MLGIINIGLGNIGSVRNACDRIGLPFQEISSEKELSKFSHLILPGVGAFSHAITALNSKNLIAGIKEHSDAGKPLLGICLGMQLLFSESFEHGYHEGLDIIKGSVLPFKNNIPKELAVPHVGWNTVINCRDEKLGLVNQTSYYFVHSYYCKAENNNDILAQTEYGLTFESAVRYKNTFGLQFHPEKSHKDGQALIENFWKI